MLSAALASINQRKKVGKTSEKPRHIPSKLAIIGAASFQNPQYNNNIQSVTLISWDGNKARERGFY